MRATRPSTAEQIGRLLARFHLICDEIDTKLTRPTLDPGWMIDAQLAAIQAVLNEGEPRLKRLLSIADVARKQLTSLPMDGPGFGLIHGDLIPSNLLRAPDGDLALLDFDMAGYGWRAFDIATYQHELKYWRAPDESANAFIVGYESVRPLANWERDAIGALKAARAVIAIGIPAAHVNEWGRSTLPDDLIDRLLELGESSGA